MGGNGPGDAPPIAGPLLGGPSVEKPGPEAASQGGPHEASQLFFCTCAVL